MKFMKFLIASFGGYLFASLATTTLAFALPLLNKAEAVSLATMLSFIIWLLFIIYTFSSVKVKNLLVQLSLICTNLYLINTCFMAIKA